MNLEWIFFISEHCKFFFNRNMYVHMYILTIIVSGNYIVELETQNARNAYLVLFRYASVLQNIKFSRLLFLIVERENLWV